MLHLGLLVELKLHCSNFKISSFVEIEERTPWAYEQKGNGTFMAFLGEKQEEYTLFTHPMMHEDIYMVCTLLLIVY